MNISQIICRLQELKEEYGDLDCYLPSNTTKEGSVPIDVDFVVVVESLRSEYVIIT